MSDYIISQIYPSDILANKQINELLLAEGIRLSQDGDLPHLGVGEIGQHEVDQSIGAAEGYGGLGAVLGERHQPLAFATGQDDRKNLGTRGCHVLKPILARRQCRDRCPDPEST